ncbi:MAG: LamG domain-containing protein [Candidatus Micrarchaeota archaeon]|nr:LamG domain-containing protein [Candidatus Micrarchaeota archaeon]
MQSGQLHRGVFLSLDVVVAMMVIFVSIMLSFSIFSSAPAFDPSSAMLDAYLQDAASVLLRTGSLNLPISSQQSSPNASAILKILQATPDSVCMQLEAYCTEAPEGLQAYWKFDESFGPFLSDSSGNGHTALMFLQPSLVFGGASGNSIYFSGQNFVGTDFDFSWNDNQSVTISLWVKPESVSGMGGIIGKSFEGWEWVIYRDGSEAGFYYMDQAGGGSNMMQGTWGNVLSAGQWTHLAYVWDGSSSHFYANGQQINSAYAGNPSYNQDSGEGVAIGGNVNFNGQKLYFIGQIDDVRFYGRALSAEEIRRLYNNPSNLAFVAEKPGCKYAGGQVRSQAIPLAQNADQGQNNYCHALLKGWLRGERNG